MKKKGNSTQEKSAISDVLCPKCGNGEFDRSLSESGALVRLVWTPKGIAERIIRPGGLEFGYTCANCHSALSTSTNPAQK